MSVPHWPADLPRPRRAGYQAQTIDPRLKRKAETGPPSYRRRWSATVRTVTLTLKVSRAQKAVFDRFIDEVIEQGSTPFYMPDPTTDGWPVLADGGAPLLTGTGAPLLMAARWLCLLGDDMPRETIQGTRFLITLTVLVMP